MRVGCVLLLGVGGTGTMILEPLARTLAYHPSASNSRLTIWDGDKYEERNLERQLFPASLVGHNKAAVALSMVYDIVKTHEITHYMASKDDMVNWLMDAHKANEPGEFSLIIPCVDNDATRAMVYDGIDDVPSANVVVIDPANGLDNGNVCQWVRFTDSNGVTYAPLTHPRVYYPQLAEPKDRPPGGGCAEETPDEPQLIIANMMAATLALTLVHQFLEGFSRFEDIGFDLKDMTVVSQGAEYRQTVTS